MASTQSTFAFAVFEHAFKQYGMPAAIRADNGIPFASPNALFGQSRLSIWWLRLGIDIERTKPGHPEQNGRRYPAEVYTPSSRVYRVPDESQYPFH